MVFYYIIEFLALIRTFQDTSQVCIGYLKQSKIKAIWYALNKQNQTLKSLFDFENNTRLNGYFIYSKSKWGFRCRLILIIYEMLKTRFYPLIINSFII